MSWKFFVRGKVFRTICSAKFFGTFFFFGPTVSVGTAFGSVAKVLVGNFCFGAGFQENCVQCKEKHATTVSKVQCAFVNRTPTQTACTDAHGVSQHILNRMITFHHANTRGSRLHSIVCQNSCHPRVMSRSLPHLTLTTSTSSLSPASHIFPTFSSSHPSPVAHGPYLPCEDSRQSWWINTNPMSHMF